MMPQADLPLQQQIQPATGPKVPLVVQLECLLVDQPKGLETLACNGFMGLSGRTWHGRTDHVRDIELRADVVELIENAEAGGREIYILAGRHGATAPDAFAAMPASWRIIIAGDGESDAAAIKRTVGEDLYDFAGSLLDDSCSWRDARQAIGINMDSGDIRRMAGIVSHPLVLSRRAPKLSAMLQLVRPHQWVKNALLFVPLLTSHQVTGATLQAAVMAFLAFSFAASAVYVLNDAVDVEADREHPTKRFRPFASRALTLREGLALLPVLLLLSGLAASQLPWNFIGLLAGYLALTTAYSFALKRMMLVDVTVLSLLYTLRVIAGAAAIDVTVSEWLFAFSLLMFTSLALTKRYVELSTRLDKDLPDPANRDYKVSDLPIISGLAAAAGMNAITVLALYVNSEAVRKLYGHPALLWLLCPLFLYWTSRVLLLAHRRQMHDDPIVFALKDLRSWLVGAFSLAILALAL